MFGWDTTNLRRLADTYAERTGYVVYVPDFMHGRFLVCFSSDGAILIFKPGTSAPAWLKPVLDKLTNEGGFWGWIQKP
jgi:hypothetical protein